MPQQKASGLVEAGQRGCRWIVSHQRPDGSLCNLEDGVGSYYKVPFALSLAGRVREAQWVWGTITSPQTVISARLSERRANPSMKPGPAIPMRG